jgi:hypothetical protein
MAAMRPGLRRKSTRELLQFPVDLSVDLPPDCDLVPSKSSDGRRDRRLGGQGSRDEGDPPEPGMFPPVSRCGHQGTVCQSEGSQRLPCRLSCQGIETEQAAWDV